MGAWLRSRKGRTVADAHAAEQPGQGGCVKDIPDHAVRLALVEAALMAAGDDAARVLAAVLQERKEREDLVRGRGRVGRGW